MRYFILNSDRIKKLGFVRIFRMPKTRFGSGNAIHSKIRQYGWNALHPTQEV